MSRRIWLTAAMCSMWFIRRFPARDNRCRFCSPDEASRGAVPVQDAKRFRSPNRATSPTSAKVLAATTGPTPWMSINVEPRATTRVLSSAVAFLIFASTATRSASSSAAIRRRVLPAMSRGRTVARIALACRAVRSFLALAGDQLGQQPLEPVHGLDPQPGQLVAPVGEHPQCLELTVPGQHAQVLGADRDDRDGVGVAGIGLAVVTGVEEPDPGRELGRDIDDVLARLEESLRQWTSGPLLPSIAQTRSDHAFT